MEITNSTTETSQLRPPPPINAQQIKALWRQSGRKIHKVPQLLRQGEHNSDAYDPKVVSFGPYHYGKPELQLCQEAKHFVLQMFVEGGGKSREFFHQGVLEVISDARSCYVEGSTDFYTDEHFAEMMLLDACFLIYYLKIGPQNQLSRLLIYNRLGGLVLSLVGRDIFLLENQIPLQILMLLINLRYERNEAEENLSRFLHESFWGRPYKHHEIQQIQRLKLKKPLHLLEACHQTLVWDWNPEIQPANEDFDSKKHHKTFRSAKNLKAKGIHFKPSSKKSLKDINFKSFAFYGLLELPVWVVSNLSQVFFPNIIAYELCPNNPVGTTVISYVDFMKSLIDSPADVKELREKKILLTSFGSDEEVVRLFRELNTYGIESTYNFLDVEQRIQKHYYSKAKTWMAELIHTYFSSPWSFIAWFAGLWLLILTSVQTYFTINPRK